VVLTLGRDHAGGHVLIVITGGRASPRRPRLPDLAPCTDESLVPKGELGIHGRSSSGNRLVTFLLAAVAIATFLAALKFGRRSLVRLALIIESRPRPAVFGGITVLSALTRGSSGSTDVSMAMIQVAW